VRLASHHAFTRQEPPAGMRILHVASFQGNVGDNANHNGLRSQLSKVLPANTSYEELEIRRFYQKYDGKDKLQFDEAFAELSNKFDLMIIGGGNFLEIWIETSTTGCTIDIPPHVLDAIRTPIVFFGLGFHTYKGSTKETRSRFLCFLQKLLSEKRFLMTVRNDGSIGQLEACYGPQVAQPVMKVPDGGFYVRLDGTARSLTQPERCNIVLSIAEDMLEVRFPGAPASDSYQLLVSNFAEYIKQMSSIRKDAHFLLMPHIYSDLHIISEIVNCLPDHVRRKSVTVGPYVTGPGSESIVFSTYREATCVLAMRLHGNVVPIGLNVPTLGIGTYGRIAEMYRELGHTERLVEVEKSSFADALAARTESLLATSHAMKQENQQIMGKLDAMMNHFLDEFKEFAKL
jgi:polysaccharide pyruvyl transferase WcaK-like protein